MRYSGPGLIERDGTEAGGCDEQGAVNARLGMGSPIAWPSSKYSESTNDTSRSRNISDIIKCFHNHSTVEKSSKFIFHSII